jgi:Trypsin-like peptidase domain/Concanavalin A-like lectin/glucanases superfamily
VFNHYVDDDNGIDVRIEGTGMAIAVGLGGKGFCTRFGVLDYGQWSHVAAVLGSGGMRLYVNGQLISENQSFKASFKDLGRSNASAIGRTYYSKPHLGGPSWFKGELDEFMIFDRALSDADVAALFKAQGGRPTRTIASSGGSSVVAKLPTSSAGTVRPKPLPRLDIASGSGERYTMASLYRRVAPSVVVVSAPGSSGSGFCIGRSDIIMSNAHVVQSAKRVTVVSFTYNRNELVVQEEIGANVIYVNPTEDVAVLQLDSHRHALSPLPVARKNPAAGIRVCALGSPGIGGRILAQTLTEGIVSSGAREFGGQSWLQHTAAVNPGNSGGPLLDELGEVVGMNTLKAFLDGVSFAIPAEKIREVFSH